MNEKFTPVFKSALLQSDKRIIILYGGTWSSKTISALQFCTLLAKKYSNKIFTIIGESVPVLKRTVIRDWQKVVMQEDFKSDNFHRVELTYTFPKTRSLFQFVPADDPDRFLGMRQDYAMFDEASNIKKAVFDQVEIRTHEKLFLTFNPTHEFWIKDVMLRDDCAVIHSTYKDNPHVSDSIIKTLERRAATDKNFYDVYVLGKWGVMEGLIFREDTNWFPCHQLPVDFQYQIFGLDFGFTNDPSTLVELRESDGQIWVKEHFYEPGLTNDVIAAKIKQIVPVGALVVADSAEPKSIEEIRRARVNIRASLKGPDSVNYGIGLMKQYRINVTKDSINGIKEFRNYAFAKNKFGESTGKPIDNWNHFLDALRYALMYKKRYRSDGKYSVS